MSQDLAAIPEEAVRQEDNVEVIDQDSGTEVYDSEAFDGESIVGSEYPENDIRMLADSLITANGEVIADVFAGIRDALEKLNKILYNKLSK
jgi:hypothetical protein